MKGTSRWIVFLFLILTCGCANTVVPARLYSLDHPDVAAMSFRFTGERNGVARAVLPSGENLSGEFVIWVERSGALDYEAVEEEGWGQVKTVDPTKPVEWPVVYGYGSKSEVAEPVGSAMLLGSSGTTLEVLLYHAVFETSLVADGLARDNQGNWYRVMLGDLD